MALFDQLDQKIWKGLVFDGQIPFIKFLTKLQLRVWEVFTNLEESKFNFFTLSVEANLAEAKTIPSLSYVEQFFTEDVLRSTFLRIRAPIFFSLRWSA
jgi:hypothetical protein